MRLHDLCEAPLDGGDLRPSADKFAASMIPKFQDTAPIADIEEFSVKKLQAGNGYHYALFSGGDAVLLAFVKPLDKMMYPVLKIAGKAAEVDDVWVAADQVGKRIYSKFLWFLKSREGFYQLMTGKVQLDDTIKFLRAGGLSKFNKTWQNTATGEIQNFDAGDMDKFYSTRNWRLVLENESTEFDDFSRFNTGRWIEESYDWQIS